MSNTQTSIILNNIIHRVRSSVIYSDWVKRNKGFVCCSCNSTESLELHHIIPLYENVLHVWKHYENEDLVCEHVLAQHQNNTADCITLCKKCHSKKHYKTAVENPHRNVQVDSWCVIPRNLKLIPNQSTKETRNNSVGLITYQTLLGIGWYILNGKVDQTIFTIHRRRFAELIGKTPGDSFNHSLMKALDTLLSLKIIQAYCSEDNDIEIHLSSQYLNMLEKNPWFFPMCEIKTNSMCVLSIRLWLGMQNFRKTYKIGLDKLKSHLGIEDTQNKRVLSKIKKAMLEISWATIKPGNMVEFKFYGKSPTPIRSLREVLEDVMQYAK